MTPDLGTRYLGMDLRSPLVAAPSPLTEKVENLQILDDLGAGAVVLPSLFEEQIEHEQLQMQLLREFGADAHAEATVYFPTLEGHGRGARDYLDLVRAARAAVKIPVIASLNGHSPGGWVRYARQIEEAGASALELNIYFVPVDPGLSGSAVEDRYVELVRSVRAAVQLPLAVKIGPQFTAPLHFVRRLADAGADGVVLFNRLLEPDIDLELMSVVPRMAFSTRRDLGLPLRWVSILHGHVRCSLAATTGAHQADDAIKLLLGGADVVMIAAALLLNGPEHLSVMTSGLSRWMEDNGYASVRQMKGSMSRASCPNPDGFDRANYMKALTSHTGLFI